MIKWLGFELPKTQAFVDGLKEGIKRNDVMGTFEYYTGRRVYATSKGEFNRLMKVPDVKFIGYGRIEKG